VTKLRVKVEQHSQGEAVGSVSELEACGDVWRSRSPFTEESSSGIHRRHVVASEGSPCDFPLDDVDARGGVVSGGAVAPACAAMRGDPMLLFGGLSPPPLKRSKSDFAAGGTQIYLLPHCARVWSIEVIIIVCVFSHVYSAALEQYIEAASVVAKVPFVFLSYSFFFVSFLLFFSHTPLQ
jgi:hypothetical protein